MGGLDLEILGDLLDGLDALERSRVSELLAETWKRGSHREVRLLGVGVRFENPRQIEQMEFFDESASAFPRVDAVFVEPDRRRVGRHIDEIRPD